MDLTAADNAQVLPMVTPVKKSRKFKRRENFALRSTLQAMKLIRESLNLDLVELWKLEGGEKECVFIHATDAIVKARDDVIVSNYYYPRVEAGKKHHISPYVRGRE